MKLDFRSRFAILISAAVFTLIGTVQADGYHAEETAVQPQPTHDTSTPPSEASDASFDKRLPPVFPGEIVNDSGRKIRVWSTAGPVPVSSAPEPWKENLTGAGNGAGIGLGSVGVIIDRDKQSEKKGKRELGNSE